MNSAGRLARWATAIALAVAATGAAGTEPYPSRPIRIVVPFAAGGIADLTARTVAQKMGESMGQPLVIENRPGAGGVVAAQAVAKAEPDGYTLLLMSNGNAVTAGLFRSLPFDTLKDFVPISTLGFFDLVVVTRADSPLQSFAELMAAARERPGKLNIGTINIGSTQNLAAELLKIRAGVDAQIVPFNGTPALVSALLGGSVDCAVEILGPVASQITVGKLRALVVMGARRRAGMPEVPTATEAGVAEFEVSSWNALAAPARTPAAVVARLNREINAAVASPDVKAKLAMLGVDARAGSPDEARVLLASEIQRWSDVIAKAGIPKQ